MDFSGINYIAIGLAALASMMIGAGWYGRFGKQWMRAAKIDPSDIEPKPSLYITAALCQIVIAFFLAGLIGHLGEPTLGFGVTVAFFCWLGFVLPPMAMNHRFQGFGWNLTLIDSGNLLLSFIVQGAIIGWFGV